MSPNGQALDAGPLALELVHRFPVDPGRVEPLFDERVGSADHLVKRPVLRHEPDPLAASDQPLKPLTNDVVPASHDLDRRAWSHPSPTIAA